MIDLQNGKPLSVNEIGELCFKGPTIMKGYYKNPVETANTIDVDGWLHTGDIGYYDKDYNFYIVDRLKELIKYKGYQVKSIIGLRKLYTMCSNLFDSRLHQQN